MVTFNPFGLVSDTFTPDSLLAGDELTTLSAVLDSYASATNALYARGRLLNKDKDGKFRPLADAETAVALNAVLVVDDFGTTTVDDYWFMLALPPIPGTVHVVTVDEGTTTVVLEAGTDDGHGHGEGAGGWFDVDYDSGQVHVHFNTHPSDNDDLTYAYKHHSPITNGAGVGETGMPMAILAEDVAGADVIAGDVTAIVYIGGSFLASALKGYSAGYKDSLRALNIVVK
jgi:hypothetical protein